MTAAERPLPEPDSAELAGILRSKEKHKLYKFLYERRDNPPTMVEIQAHADAGRGESHAQTGRRVRELRKWFLLRTVQKGRTHYYELRGWQTGPTSDSAGISGKVRGEVLSSNRCAQCGKTPSEDGVKLEVDHKVPQSWGGTDDIDNLQPLCTQCNHDKQAFYATMDPFEDQIRAATQHMEPHRRIGELLKAFAAAGAEAPSQVVGVVASMHQYQEDWQKRMRELRELGWDYTTRKETRPERVHTFYILTKWTEWPEGDTAAEIRRREKARKAQNPKG
ncbi:HNH endonuclease [Leucobacter sp. PH1c]|uniref:HNH endonuclease n=1 Tax=Leucobacter sp. PH1c TaxID=1397278 RepID=UPI000469F432|nr:HNH endonuclease [Leucobacter sp. PH1c]